MKMGKEYSEKDKRKTKQEYKDQGGKTEKEGNWNSANKDQQNKILLQNLQACSRNAFASSNQSTVLDWVSTAASLDNLEVQ